MRTFAQILRFASLLMIAGTFPLALRGQPADSQPPGNEVTLQEYIAELRSASTILDGENTNAMRDFRMSLPSEWVVRVEGPAMRVKTDWLAAALAARENAPQASADQWRQGRQHLNALSEAAEALLAPSDGADLGESRARVDRILRAPEFQGSHEPTWFDKLRARVFGWIYLQLDKLFGRIGISASVGNSIAWTLLSLVALLLAFWAVRSMIAAATRSEIDLRGATPAGQDWRYWAREARAAAARDDFRAAIHAAYWTAVSQLEENRLLPGDRSRTPRESLRLVRRASEVYGPLANLTRRFELTWYGYRPATSADWDDAMKQLETLECLRSSTRATANS